MNAEDKLRALPFGTFRGRAHDKTFVISKTGFANGASLKLVAEALDGSDYISLNMYDLAAGARLFPCEMPMAKVLAFLEQLEIDHQV